MHLFQMSHASKIIHYGGVIACPTEAVYGLSCHPLIPDAVSTILSLKHRSQEKGLIVVASDISQLTPFTTDPSIFNQQNIKDSWPGATTWLVPAKATVPAWLTGTSPTIAVRITNHPVMAELCRQCGHALISTSANISGQHPAVNALQVRKAFASSLDWILHADTGHNTQVSKIYDAISGSLIRS